MQATPKQANPNTPLAGEDSSCQTAHSLAQIQAYHQRSKHKLERYAAGPDTLDWDAQPNPFREFSATPRIQLDLFADQLTASFDALNVPGTVVPQPITLNTVAALMELAFGLSAWKEYGPDRWAVRCNPSSGNLHPTEAYVICRQIHGIEDGVYHYLSRDHQLEQRCKFVATTTGTPSRLLVGLSSIIWREAWKYGERAFRYCQLDTGHAIAALRYAAATLGWSLHIEDSCSQQQIAQWLGLDRNADFTGAEREEAELLMEITTGQTANAATLSNMLKADQTQWYGRANILDAHPMYHWPVIDEVTQASRKPFSPPATVRPTDNWPAPKRDGAAIHNATLHDVAKAATLIRQRRSAQRFDAKFTQDAASFYRMLDALLPRHTVPWDVWHKPARVHPVLFVHRVAGLEPGIYALPRNHAAQLQMQTAMSRDFVWTKPADCPGHLPLFRLAETNLTKTAKTMNCHQAIAGDSNFTLAMLAEFDAPLQAAPWRYRQLFWEAGLLGQVLYLEAEAARMRGTGIGCYFDDVCHELLGLQGTIFQSLYHFTVGYPLTDERIANLPPYLSSPANSSNLKRASP
ncbi:MAG TPA: SagB family peptide dehydrogenase [Gallionella sp.]|nr:SagB family peptide dehydrogenase [Gallionella sp.]